MALYRARWASPETGRALFRDFHTKAGAMAFQALPRDHLVFVELYKQHRFDLTERRSDAIVLFSGSPARA